MFEALLLAGAALLPMISPCFYRFFNKMPPFSAICSRRYIKNPVKRIGG